MDSRPLAGPERPIESASGYSEICAARADRFGNPVAHSIAGLLRVKTLDASDLAQQLRDGTKRDLTGVRLAEDAEHLHIAATPLA